MPMMTVPEGLSSGLARSYHVGLYVALILVTMAILAWRDSRQSRLAGARRGRRESRRALKILLALAVWLRVLVPSAGAQDAASGPNDWFRVTYAPAGPSFAPTIKGSVYNGSPYRVTDVRLQVDGLDADNGPVGRRFVWAFGDIVPGGQTSFAAEPIPGALSYRITVSSFDVVAVGESRSVQSP